MTLKIGYTLGDTSKNDVSAQALYAEAHRQHGLGDIEQAYRLYQSAINICPDFPEALTGLGRLLCDQGYFEAAAVCCRKAHDLKPKLMNALVILCRALTQLDRMEEVKAHCQIAIKRSPFAVQPLVELARVHRRAGRLDDCISCLKRAAFLKPSQSYIHNFLCFVQRQRGDLPAAVASGRKAVSLDQNSAEAHGNLAIALLAMGHLPEGWREYEWRWKTPDLVKTHRHFVQPQWRGEEARGRTLLIHAEQGFGDTLQFCRYASLAVQKGFNVILEVQPTLKKLLGSLAGVDRVIERGEDLPPFDLHCPMLSLPQAFATDLTNIPSAAPYLHQDEKSSVIWRQRVANAADNNDLKIGLAWQGSRTIEADRRRSIPFEKLQPIADIPRLRLFSLQKDITTSSNRIVDFMGEVEDFSDTAALISTLDLVISVDTAVAHLAASIGKPCWLLNRFDSCWRWLTGRRDSPWYPTLTLYTQSRPGDWETVISQVIADLESLVGKPVPL